MSWKKLRKKLRAKSYEVSSLIVVILFMSLLFFPNVKAEEYKRLEYSGEPIRLLYPEVIIDELVIASDGENVIEIIPIGNVTSVKIVINSIVFSKPDATLLNLIKIDSSSFISARIIIKNVIMPEKAYIKNLVSLKGVFEKVNVLILNSTLVIDNVLHSEIEELSEKVYVELIDVEMRTFESTDPLALIFSTKMINVNYRLTNSTILDTYYPLYTYTGSVISLPKRVLNYPQTRIEGFAIAILTIAMISMGVYIEHRTKKFEKIEEIILEE